ncbi:nicotinamide riboside transporter PnuC [Prolixibacteraceae bacterium JC049]|nr:nicotinamide riboside transporter PnuC [Prolixibacteraceae bacterium JC049]
MIDWIINNYIELFGAITGLAFLYFEIKEKIWLWPLGILTSLFYIYIFFVAKFYADMGLQFYYLFIGIYGWYTWSKGTEDKPELPVVRINQKQIGLLALIGFALFFVLSFVLSNYTDSPLPYWDAFTTSLSIIATWMLTRKILEQWLVWIVVNFISLGLYIYKDLYATSVLFLAYGVLSFVGYYKWKKNVKVK